MLSLGTSKAVCINGISPLILKECASVLSKPLHYLFSVCLEYSIIPKEWKSHIVTPVYKSGDKGLIKNYRPKSLLCNTAKNLECIIYV